ncbi:MAG: hypothetical protein ACXWRE_05830 [Pseudobdellovibrionaceae bacterium]
MRALEKNLPITLMSVLGMLFISAESFAVCDQTLSAGANVASAIANAASGSTICLNGGSYSLITLTSIIKTSDVILQSTSGRTATLSLNVSGSNHLKFQNLTIAGMNMNNGGNLNISILNNTFTDQLQVVGSGNSSTLANILIDGNTFDGISVCTNCYEGRLQLYDAGGVTVSNNHFGKAGESDGIQWGGYGGTVGPGNVFEGLIQGNYGRHVDAIQLYGQVDHTTITGNYFNNDTMYIGAYDGGANIFVTNNVFGPGDTNLSGQPMQFGAIQGLTFIHNTVSGDYVVAQGAKFGDLQNTNALYRNNIFNGTSIADTGDQPGCSGSCVYDRNLFASSGSARGTNNLIGLPSFVGGSQPSTWAGYQLNVNSLGYRAATDGNDLGVNYYGTGSLLPSIQLTAPTGLRIVQ